MNIKNLFIFLSLLSFNSFARDVDTLANCRLSNSEQEESLASFTILRDGDRLYGRYRLNEGRDFEETDDIFMKKYEGESLSLLKESGTLKLLTDALKIEMDKVEKVTFFGMVEVGEDEDEDEDDNDQPNAAEANNFSGDDENPAPNPNPPKFLMEIYQLTGSLGVSLGSVGKPLEKAYTKCSGSRFFIFP